MHRTGFHPYPLLRYCFSPLDNWFHLECGLCSIPEGWELNFEVTAFLLSLRGRVMRFYFLSQKRFFRMLWWGSHLAPRPSALGCHSWWLSPSCFTPLLTFFSVQFSGGWVFGRWHSSILTSMFGLLPISSKDNGTDRSGGGGGDLLLRTGWWGIAYG